MQITFKVSMETKSGKVVSGIVKATNEKMAQLIASKKFKGNKNITVSA